MAIPNSSDILQAVIEATPDAIFIKDLDGCYVIVNEAGSRANTDRIYQELRKKADDSNSFSGNVFTVNGPKLGRDSAIVGGGINVQWTPTLATFANYDGELGRTNYIFHNVSGGFRLRF